LAIRSSSPKIHTARIARMGTTSKSVSRPGKRMSPTAVSNLQLIARGESFLISDKWVIGAD